MELTKCCCWILVSLFVFIDEIVHVSAAFCSYETISGEHEVRNCPGRCCSDTYKGPVCCEFNYPSGAFVGAGVGTIIVLGVIVLCTLYICCKQRLMNSYRRSTAQQRSSHSTGARGHDVPSVTASVDPILPPPYESLPPPYYTNDVEMGENSNETKDKKYPDYPPPGYTEESSNQK